MAGEREWLKQADHTRVPQLRQGGDDPSGGALGLSVVFIHDLALKTSVVALLAVAWAPFTTSMLAILVSLMTGQASLRREMRAIDESRVFANPGGGLGRVTCWVERGRHSFNKDLEGSDVSIQ